VNDLILIVAVVLLNSDTLWPIRNCGLYVSGVGLGKRNQWLSGWIHCRRWARPERRVRDCVVFRVHYI